MEQLSKNERFPSSRSTPGLSRRHHGDSADGSAWLGESCRCRASAGGNVAPLSELS